MSSTKLSGIRIVDVVVFSNAISLDTIGHSRRFPSLIEYVPKNKDVSISLSIFLTA